MQRTFSFFLCLFFLATSVAIGTELPIGTFQVASTAGFVEEDGFRKPLETDNAVGTANIELRPDDSFQLKISGSEIQLFPLKNGLATLEWNAEDTALLHGVDIQAILKAEDRSEIPAWGADLAWPGAGAVQLVIFPLRPKTYAGFLVSRLQKKTVVRQMEFRQVFGPSNRPHFSVRRDATTVN